MKTRKEQYTMLLNQGEQGIVVSERKKKQQKKQDGWYYLGVVGQIGFTISLPIAGGAILGTYIDHTRSTSPKATVMLLFIGFAISFLGFIRTIQELIKKK